MVEGVEARGHRAPLGHDRHATAARHEFGEILFKLAVAALIIVYLGAMGWVMVRFVAMHRCAGTAIMDPAACDKVMQLRTF